MILTQTWTNRNPNTIWNRLAERLGREPTHAEATAEVKRILQQAAEARELAKEFPNAQPMVRR